MPATTSRSPSPAAAPPIAATPGPRAALLQKLYGEAINHTLRTCSHSNFASCFPTPAKHAPDAMKHLHGDFVDKLHRTCTQNFDLILQDRDVVASLNDLDRLVADARKRRAQAEQDHPGQPVNPPVAYVYGRPIPLQVIIHRDINTDSTSPHTLPPASLYLSHLAPVLAETQASLSTRLPTVHSENTDLVEAIIQQRREIEGLVSGLEAVIADVDAANAALPSEDTMALTEEAVALDVDLRKNS